MGDVSRRRFIYQTLGLSSVGWRALASGIPARILLNPAAAEAAEADVCSEPQYLILSMSDNGDPVGCNMPGTYLDAGVAHPSGEAMAPVNLTVGGKQYLAARPWSTLPAGTLGRTSFFHHGTYTVVHGENRYVQTLQGAMKNNEMMASLYARELAKCLGTVQSAPVCLGPEILTYEGRTLPSMSPAAIATALTLPDGPLRNLQPLRDSTVNALNDFYRQRGNSAQRQFIDRYARSQSQARDISQALLQNLSSIRDSSASSQVAAAIALIGMNVTPVVTLNIPFGADNHNNLTVEGEQNVTGMQIVNNLLSQLASTGLADKVTFLSLNVFGRMLASVSAGGSIREHSGNHHGALLIGKHVRSSVIGGIERKADIGDFSATSIDAVSGAPGGNIPYTETLAALGKTVGRALGLPKTLVDDSVTAGQIVQAALIRP